MRKNAKFSAAAVDVICFDLCETLVAWNDAYDVALREAASEWAGRWSEGNAEEQSWQDTLSETYWRSRRRGEGRKDAIRRSLGILPIDADERIVSQVARTARRLQPLRCSLIPGVETALTQLSSKYRLAVLTNLDEVRTKQLWDRLQLDRYIRESDLFYASKIGRKPSLRLYRTVASRLGAPVERCLMVGNSYRNDCMGAARAGWKAVWIKKGVRPSLIRYRRSERIIRRIPSVKLLPRLLQKGKRHSE